MADKSDNDKAGADMRLNDLLRDVTGSTPGASQRSQHIALAEMLNERHGTRSITPKGVEQWFSRKSIPGTWLMRICALGTPRINPADYA